MASSWKQYITGNLDTMQHAKRVKLFYGILIASSLATFVVYICKAAKIQDGKVMKRMEFRFLIAGLVQ